MKAKKTYLQIYVMVLVESDTRNGNNPGVKSFHWRPTDINSVLVPPVLAHAIGLSDASVTERLVT